MVNAHYHCGFNKLISYKNLKDLGFATETQKHKKTQNIFKIMVNANYHCGFNKLISCKILRDLGFATETQKHKKNTKYF